MADHDTAPGLEQDMEERTDAEIDNDHDPEALRDAERRMLLREEGDEEMDTAEEREEDISLDEEHDPDALRDAERRMLGRDA